jgi:hypothetical protein
MAESPRGSLDQQLSAAKAVPGSRLEQLIRNNQDLHLLHTRESAGDRTGLPLWLRVYWRKRHPETPYSPDDPTGGYPRALKNLHAWMVEHQDLPGVDVSAGDVPGGRK